MPKIIKTKSKKKIPDKPLFVHMFYAFVGLVITIVSFLIICYSLVKGGELSQFTKICLFIIVGISSALSGFLSHKRIRGRGYINGIVAALMYELMLIILITCAMRFQVSVPIIYTIPITVLCGATGGIISANIK